MGLLANKIMFLEKTTPNERARDLSADYEKELKKYTRKRLIDNYKQSFGGLATSVFANDYANLFRAEEVDNIQDVEVAWSKQLFRNIKLLHEMEKSKNQGPYFSNNLKELTKYFIKKDLRPYFKQSEKKHTNGRANSFDLMAGEFKDISMTMDYDQSFLSVSPNKILSI